MKHKIRWNIIIFFGGDQILYFSHFLTPFVVTWLLRKLQGMAHEPHAMFENQQSLRVIEWLLVLTLNFNQVGGGKGEQHVWWSFGEGGTRTIIYPQLSGFPEIRSFITQTGQKFL